MKHDTNLKIICCAFLMLSLFISPLFSKDQKELEEIIKTIIEDKQPAESTSTAAAEKQANKKEKEIKTTAQEQVLLKNGIQFFENHLYDNALNKFNELKTKYPESSFKDSASVWIAKIQMQNNNLDQALSELRSISETSGEYPASLFYIGDIDIKKKDNVAAIESLSKVAAQYPENELADDALIMLARLYLDANRGSQSLEAVLRVIKNYPKRETQDDAYYLLGKIFERDEMLRDFGIARKIYRLFIKKAETDKIEPFSNSPLTKRVKNDLEYLENTYFKLEK